MMETILLTAFLLVLIICSAYCSLTEVSFFSLSPMQVKVYRNSENPRYRLIATLLANPRALIVTVFLMNTFFNIMLQNVASDIFSSFGGWTLRVILPLVITLIFCEVIPKNLGLIKNTQFSYYVAPAVNFFQNITEPVRRFIVAVTNPISRILFFYLKKAEGISREELRHTLTASEEYGILHPEEAEFVWGYLNLQEASVKEVMRQKDDILYYQTTEPLSKLIHLFADQQCSRVPVCSNGIQSVIGIISAKQFFVNKKKIKEPSDLLKFLAKPFFVPESTPVRLLLKRFEEHNEKIALVVDEYGVLSGLITHEDIAELIIGEIEDLRDQELLFTRAGQNEIIADGRMELSEFTEIFEEDLRSPSNMVTIGGWLIEQLGEIPKSGREYETDKFLFHVLASEPNRIKKVYIRKK